MEFLPKNKYPTKDNGIPVSIMKIWDDLPVSDGLLLKIWDDLPISDGLLLKIWDDLPISDGLLLKIWDDLPISDGLLLKIWDDLSIGEGLLLRQERIVVPENLQTKIIKIAQEGHLGMVNTKRLLRSKVWFPKLDKAVEEEIKNCHTYQSYIEMKKEPLVITEMPNGHWEHVKYEFFGPLPSGDYILEVPYRKIFSRE